jgi:hypothetical protein
MSDHIPSDTREMVGRSQMSETYEHSNNAKVTHRLLSDPQTGFIRDEFRFRFIGEVLN